MFTIQTLKNYLLILFLVLFCTVTADTVTQGSSEKKKMGSYSGAKDATHPDWFKESFLDLEEDIAEASENNKRLVVYFWQPGCPYCSQLWEENFSQPEIVEKFRNNFEIVAINMWGDREVVSVGGNDYSEKSFAEALRIQYTPTLLFFNEKRKVVRQINGYTPAKNFQLNLDYVAGKHEGKQSFGEFAAARQLADKSKKVANAKLNQEDFYTLSDNLDRSRQQGDGYLAVYFEAPDCVNCDLLHNKTLKDKTTRELAKKFTSVQFDRFSDAEVTTPAGKKTAIKDWANDLGISYLPAIVFFDKNGKEAMRIDAQMRTFHVQSVFDFVLSGAYKTENNFQRWISARAEHIREQGIDVDIFAY